MVKHKKLSQGIAVHDISREKTQGVGLFEAASATNEIRQLEFAQPSTSVVPMCSTHP